MDVIKATYIGFYISDTKQVNVNWFVLLNTLDKNKDV